VARRVDLERELEAIEREAKSERIAYQLLRSRGEDAESPACRGLMKREQRLRSAADSLRRFLGRLQTLANGLEDLGAAGDAGADATGPNRTGSRSEIRPLIPSLYWDGGLDQYMRIERGPRDRVHPDTENDTDERSSP
jgi:hypothetical protein